MESQAFPFSLADAGWLKKRFKILAFRSVCVLAQAGLSFGQAENILSILSKKIGEKNAI